MAVDPIQNSEPDQNFVETKQDRENFEESRRGFTLTEFLGIGLIAGGLFNVPNILKVPATNAEWMMLVIVLALFLLGGLLLLLPKVIRR
ncbi:MAG: hypothetical protein GX933_00415 [Chloroflexi bacterium]|nr:hypothetical protein [Chloroflexota bacterium]